MNDPRDETGMLQTLMERFEHHVLPRALDIKEKVDGGAVLTEGDMVFLDRALADTRQSAPVVEKHPEVQEVTTKMIQLYREITERALENEKDSGGQEHDE